MKHNPKLVEAMARALGAAFAHDDPEFVAPAYRAPAKAALTALCAHLRIPPAALAALARAEAVVVPKKATQKMGKAMVRAYMADRDIWLPMLAASPYAREASDE